MSRTPASTSALAALLMEAPPEARDRAAAELRSLLLTVVSPADPASASREIDAFCERLLPMRGPGPAPIGACATNGGIGDSEVRFRAMANLIPACVWTADAAGNITYANDRWFEFSGLTREQTAGFEWLSVIHPGDVERCVQEWTRAITERTRYSIEVRNRRHDGEYRWFLTQAVPIDDGGEPDGWVGVSTDITDLKAKEAALAIALSSERELRQTIEMFIGVVGHDLRTPLSAVRMSVELLCKAAASDRDASLLERVVRSADRMQGIIEQLLDLTRIRLGRGLDVRPAPADTVAIARAVLDELTSGRPGRHVTLDSAGTTTGVWDPDRLAQVLGNLVGNALEHGVDPISVWIDGTGPATVAIHIRNGGTIAPDVLQHLFEPFAQTRVRPSGLGLGLGLYIADQLVRAHGGHIEVASSAGAGTHVTVRLPRTAGAAA